VFAVSNATNDGKAKAIGVDNSSQIGSHVKIIGNTAYAYGSGNFTLIPGESDGVAGIQVKNNFEDDNSLFTADILSNRITVLGNTATNAQIYGIYSNHTAYSGGLLSGTIALNKGVVLGTDATNISAAETVTVINNNIETNPSNPGTLPIPPKG
jgi:hypothetical protein